MKKYNCTICGAGCYSADETKTICAECEKDSNMVEVVRCKDCVWGETGYTRRIVCDFHDLFVDNEDYCARGERREK